MKANFSDAKIYITKVLPRELKNAQDTELYIAKMEAYDQRVPSLCNNDRAHWLEHSNLCIVMPNTHTRDRSHLNGRGITFLVCNYNWKSAPTLDYAISRRHMAQGSLRNDTPPAQMAKINNMCHQLASRKQHQ